MCGCFAAEQAQDDDAADGSDAVMRGDMVRFAEIETCSPLPHVVTLLILHARHSYSIHHAELLSRHEMS